MNHTDLLDAEDAYLANRFAVGTACVLTRTYRKKGARAGGTFPEGTEVEVMELDVPERRANIWAQGRGRMWVRLDDLRTDA